mmetsp:Transcript_81733/g.162679  ORF Transcript_81733/g.162679 Transcript_81733/m.162679 type:complete len:228 (-) Transcript_81733:32-715(-)
MPPRASADTALGLRAYRTRRHASTDDPCTCCRPSATTTTTSTVASQSPRPMAVLASARSALEARDPGSDPIRTPPSDPAGFRASSPLPACRLPCQPALPQSIPSATPATPGLRSDQTAPPTAASSPSAEPRLRRAGWLGTSASAPSSPTCKSAAGCDIYCCPWCWPKAAGYAVCALAHPPHPGAAARCSRHPPDPRPPPRPPFASEQTQMACTSPPPAPPICILTGG